MGWKEISFRFRLFMEEGDALNLYGKQKWKEFLKSEMFDFIKEKSDNFDIVKFKYFIQELRELDIPFKKTSEDGKEKVDRLLMRVCNAGVDENKSLAERITTVQGEYEGSTPLLPTTILFQLSDIAETEYKRVTESAPEKPKRSKQPLTFSGLFKPKFKTSIEKFINRLRANGYIDENHIWKKSGSKNEPAKVYFWLVEKGIIISTIQPTPGLICFCKEFGITAYTDNEPTPIDGVRAVTVKNLLKVKDNSIPDKLFEKNFLTVFNE